MSKYIDADKLKAEIERRKEKWLAASRLIKKGKDKAMYAAGKSSAYTEFFSLITSLQQEQPEPFSCSYENGSEPKPEGIEAVVHHCASVHYLVTNTKQLNARLKQFDEGSKVLVYIEARKGE